MLIKEHLLLPTAHVSDKIFHFCTPSKEGAPQDNYAQMSYKEH